jgi:predicted pyridoxine 5'-phosphate oxidase superfamily flavin-nucleotide-binding protein
MSVTLTADMRAVIQAAHLCFAGTVSADGTPNVSPKGTIRAWDDQHLFFLDIASPGTRANPRARPWMELNVVDQLSRRGYRFFGPATVHVGDAVFEEAIRRVQGAGQLSYPVAAVVLLALERAAALISPAGTGGSPTSAPCGHSGASAGPSWIRSSRHTLPGRSHSGIPVRLRGRLSRGRTFGRKRGDR